MKGERNIGGLWCHEVLAGLTLFMDGDLVGDDLAAVKAHVSGCDTCARFGGAFARAVTALRAPAADTDGDGADDDFTAGVLDALDP